MGPDRTARCLPKGRNAGASLLEDPSFAKLDVARHTLDANENYFQQGAILSRVIAPVESVRRRRRPGGRVKAQLCIIPVGRWLVIIEGKFV